MVACLQLKKGGKDMKRQLIFDYENDEYLILENTECIFKINKDQLKFNSLDFYNGLYKNKNANIEIINGINDSNPQILRQGKYIFSWLEDIINRISDEVDEPEIEGDFSVENTKVIKLFDIAVCAGDGFIIDDATEYQEITTELDKADFAVKISGDSMQPNYNDGDVLIVRKVNMLNQNDIGIFTVDGNTMCKQYTIADSKTILHPLNSKYDDIEINENMCFRIQGKVIGIE